MYLLCPSTSMYLLTKSQWKKRIERKQGTIASVSASETLSQNLNEKRELRDMTKSMGEELIKPAPHKISMKKENWENAPATLAARRATPASQNLNEKRELRGQIMHTTSHLLQDTFSQNLNEKRELRGALASHCLKDKDSHKISMKKENWERYKLPRPHGQPKSHKISMKKENWEPGSSRS